MNFLTRSKARALGLHQYVVSKSLSGQHTSRCTTAGGTNTRKAIPCGLAAHGGLASTVDLVSCGRRRAFLGLLGGHVYKVNAGILPPALRRQIQKCYASSLSFSKRFEVERTVSRSKFLGQNQVKVRQNPVMSMNVMSSYCAMSCPATARSLSTSTMLRCNAATLILPNAGQKLKRKIAEHLSILAARQSRKAYPVWRHEEPATSCSLLDVTRPCSLHSRW